MSTNLVMMDIVCIRAWFILASRFQNNLGWRFRVSCKWTVHTFSSEVRVSYVIVVCCISRSWSWICSWNIVGLENSIKIVSCCLQLTDTSMERILFVRLLSLELLSEISLLIKLQKFAYFQWKFQISTLRYIILLLKMECSSTRVYFLWIRLLRFRVGYLVKAYSTFVRQAVFLLNRILYYSEVRMV